MSACLRQGARPKRFHRIKPTLCSAGMKTLGFRRVDDEIINRVLGIYAANARARKHLAFGALPRAAVSLLQRNPRTALSEQPIGEKTMLKNLLGGRNESSAELSDTFRQTFLNPYYHANTHNEHLRCDSLVCRPSCDQRSSLRVFLAYKTRHVTALTSGHARYAKLLVNHDIYRELVMMNRATATTHAIRLKRLMATMFSALFLTLSISLSAMAVYQFSQSIIGDESLANGVVKSINIAVVSLAIFELGVGVGKEYINENEDENVYRAVRRSVTRFVAVVCVALALEGLIMVIKYSQLELAGNLFYPVAIVAAAATLLVSLGGFLKLTADVEHKRIPSKEFHYFDWRHPTQRTPVEMDAPREKEAAL